MRGPSVLARLFAIPAVLRLIATAVQSMTLRQLAGLAVRDPAAFLRAVASPGTARVLIAQASRDPSVREAARAALLFTPLRYAMLGQAALWGARRLTRRDPRPNSGTPNREPRS